MGFFLAGLVVLGGLQRWWLQPLVSGLEPMALLFGAVSLTAITDNAACTWRRRWWRWAPSCCSELRALRQQQCSNAAAHWLHDRLASSKT